MPTSPRELPGNFLLEQPINNYPECFCSLGIKQVICVNDCIELKSKISIRYPAKELNIAPASVSTASNNPSRITKMPIRDLAGQPGNHRKHVPASLRLTNSHSRGFTIPGSETDFPGSGVYQIQNIDNTGGYVILRCQSNGSSAYEVTAVESFARARTDRISVSLATEIPDSSRYLELKTMQPGNPTCSGSDETIAAIPGWTG